MSEDSIRSVAWLPKIVSRRWVRNQHLQAALRRQKAGLSDGSQTRGEA